MTWKQRQRKERQKSTEVDLAGVQVRVRAYFHDTVQFDEVGKYGRLRERTASFLARAACDLREQAWDRATRVALDEALRYLLFRWDPDRAKPLRMEVAVNDTQLKFSLAVPRAALPAGMVVAGPNCKMDEAGRSLHTVRCVMDRVRRSPDRRQVIFRRALAPAAGSGLLTYGAFQEPAHEAHARRRD